MTGDDCASEWILSYTSHGGRRQLTHTADAAVPLPSSSTRDRPDPIHSSSHTHTVASSSIATAITQHAESRDGEQLLRLVPSCSSLPSLSQPRHERRMPPTLGLLLAAAAAVLLLLPPPPPSAGAQETCWSGPAPRRGAWMSVASFGARGDGQTLNTGAFARAVARIARRRGARGGTLLYVPPGVWLTGPFNLTSHMTLFLARGAIVRATQVPATVRAIAHRPSWFLVAATASHALLPSN